MNKTVKLGVKEVRISLALIGVLLVTLVVVAAKRFAGSGQSEVPDVFMDVETLVSDVVPAELHGRAGVPTVLEAQTGADRPGDGLDLASGGGPWSSHPGSLSSKGGEETAPGNYMPKLPLDAVPEAASESREVLDAEALAAARTEHSAADRTAAADLGPSTGDQRQLQGTQQPAPEPDGGAIQPHRSAIAETSGDSIRASAPAASPLAAPSDARQPSAPANGGRHRVEPGDSMWARHQGVQTPPATPDRVGRTYLVEEGDTLSIIARYELGDSDRWREIHQLNRAVLGDDFNDLRTGMRLVLPLRSNPAPITHRPTPEIRRQ